MDVGRDPFAPYSGDLVILKVRPSPFSFFSFFQLIFYLLLTLVYHLFDRC